MLKLKLVFTSVLTLISAIVFSQVELVTENQAGISRRLQHEIDMTKDPALGYVPKGRLVQAYEVRNQLLKQNNTTSLMSWVERGPDSDAVGPSKGFSILHHGFNAIGFFGTGETFIGRLYSFYHRHCHVLLHKIGIHV